MKRTSKYFRLYGKNLSMLGCELGITGSAVAYRHKVGLLKHLQITSDKSCFNVIDKRIHTLYFNIQSRCNNPKDIKYKYYGGRGIKNFLTREGLTYLWKRDNADDLKQPSIDRIDSSGNYMIENCRFIEMEENRNKNYK